MRFGVGYLIVGDIDLGRMMLRGILVMVFVGVVGWHCVLVVGRCELWLKLFLWK